MFCCGFVTFSVRPKRNELTWANMPKATILKRPDSLGRFIYVRSPFFLAGISRWMRFTICLFLGKLPGFWNTCSFGYWYLNFTCNVIPIYNLLLMHDWSLLTPVLYGKIFLLNKHVSFKLRCTVFPNNVSGHQNRRMCNTGNKRQTFDVTHCGRQF